MLLQKRTLVMFAFLCVTAGPAFAQVGQVGVASVAIGDPLSKPPQQAERVLRVGVDVFANERISTRSNDRAHLVFLDGSALTIGPSSDLVIDRFVFDPNTRTGDIAVNLSRGAFRFVGGAISNKKEVVVQAPSASVSNSFGTSTAYRPGSQIVAPLNGPPGAPILLPPGAVQALLGNFEPSPGTAGPSGNPQTINGLVNNYNGQTTNLPPTAGSQAFANFMKFDSILAANAVNQSGILA